MNIIFGDEPHWLEPVLVVLMSVKMCTAMWTIK